MKDAEIIVEDIDQIMADEGKFRDFIYTPLSDLSKNCKKIWKKYTMRHSE